MAPRPVSFDVPSSVSFRLRGPHTILVPSDHEENGWASMSRTLTSVYPTGRPTEALTPDRANRGREPLPCLQHARSLEEDEMATLASSPRLKKSGCPPPT
jgi:hypothetical protein